MDKLLDILFVWAIVLLALIASVIMVALVGVAIHLIFSVPFGITCAIIAIILGIGYAVGVIMVLTGKNGRR